MAKGKKQNRRKLLKRICPNCKSSQDLFADACRECGTNFLQEGESEIRDKIAALVDDTEEVIRIMEAGEGGTAAYKPMDRASNALRQLAGYETLPGMAEYRAAAKEALMPFRIQLMESTLKANIIMWVILIVLPVAGLILGMEISVLWLMFLPAVFWSFVTGRAWMNLRRAREQ